MGMEVVWAKKKHEALSETTIFQFCVVTLYFLGTFERLSIVSSVDILNSMVGFLGLLCDFLLFVVYLTKVKSIRGVLVFTIVVLLGIVSAWCSKSFLMIKGLLLIVCAAGEDYPKLLRSGAMAVFAALIIGLICQIIGVPSSEFRRGGLSLGFGHPNQAALFIVLMLLLLYVSNSIRGVSQKQDWYFWVFGLVLIFATGSRTALVAVTLVAILTPLINRRYRLRQNCAIKAALLCVPFAIFVFTVVSAQCLYDSTFVQNLDTVLSNRIWLNWFALDNFDINAFGQASSLHVQGVHNELRNTWNVTTTVDCTYVAALLSYGIVGLLMWLLSYVLAFRRAWTSRKAAIVAVLAVFAFYAFSESQLTDVLINFGLFCTFANLDAEVKSPSNASTGFSSIE